MRSLITWTGMVKIPSTVSNACIFLGIRCCDILFVDGIAYQKVLKESFCNKFLCKHGTVDIIWENNICYVIIDSLLYNNWNPKNYSLIKPSCARLTNLVSTNCKIFFVGET